MYSKCVVCLCVCVCVCVCVCAMRCIGALFAPCVAVVIQTYRLCFRHEDIGHAQTDIACTD